MLIRGNTPDFLNWPGSTDLLHSILSAEFVNLPSLEIQDSELMRSTESPPAETSQSPPLNLRDQDSPWLGGENAVHHLSQIINTTVSFFSIQNTLADAISLAISFRKPKALD